MASPAVAPAPAIAPGAVASRRCELPHCRVHTGIIFEKPGFYAHALCFLHAVKLAELVNRRDPSGRELPTWWDACEAILSPPAPKRARGRP